MISVIIPALNEGNTIAAVVEFARRDPRVDEVIVVDDGSIDGTVERARAAGASVMTSTLLGKGASMEDGLRAARHDTLLYLDGDLSNLHEELVPRLTGPIFEGRADFVKAKFSRSAGRVTTLTVRPLLRLFFPELGHFDQPLSGIVAARRSLLERLDFDNDYGVDVGLLIDASAAGARLAEVDIGHLVHDSHPLVKLGDMAGQVARTVLERAARYGRLARSSLRASRDREDHIYADLGHLLGRLERLKRLALFDMDGVLLQGRFVATLARRTRRRAALAQLLDNREVDGDERTRRIASLFAGVPRAVFEQVAREIPLVPGAVETVSALRKAGFCMGIITDSYSVAAEIVRRRVFADFCVAHLMRFRHAKALGQVTLSPAMVRPEGCPLHHSCKVNFLLHLMEHSQIRPDHVLAVGDGDNDICLLRTAGQSVAFQPKTKDVRMAAQWVVEGTLPEVLGVAPENFCLQGGELTV